MLNVKILKPTQETPFANSTKTTPFRFLPADP